VQEVSELFQSPRITSSTGRVFFSLPEGQDPRPLRSIEKLFVHVGSFKTPDTLADFKRCCAELPWHEAHQSIVRFLSHARPITFRVTCTRSTKTIGYTSQEAAHAIAVSVCDHLEDDTHQWQVDLREYAVEIYCPLSSIRATVGFALTKTDGTDLAHPTSMSLRQSIAYSLATLADIQASDIVLDPMCGSGSLLVHAQARAQRLNVPIHLVGGDSDSWAVEKAAVNLPGTAREGTAPSLAVWNLCSSQGGFPLRTSTVDVILCDLPFGKRCSSAGANQKLYAMALQEFGRYIHCRVFRVLTMRVRALAVSFNPFLSHSLMPPFLLHSLLVLQAAAKGHWEMRAFNRVENIDPPVTPGQLEVVVANRKQEGDPSPARWDPVRAGSAGQSRRVIWLCEGLARDEEASKAVHQPLPAALPPKGAFPLPGGVGSRWCPAPQ
jgi:23S rRNA G2445 N2-methylase RlmL